MLTPTVTEIRRHGSAHVPMPAAGGPDPAPRGGAASRPVALQRIVARPVAVRSAVAPAAELSQAA